MKYSVSTKDPSFELISLLFFTVQKMLDKDLLWIMKEVPIHLNGKLVSDFLTPLYYFFESIFEPLKLKKLALPDERNDNAYTYTAVLAPSYCTESKDIEVDRSCLCMSSQRMNKCYISDINSEFVHDCIHKRAALNRIKFPLFVVKDNFCSFLLKNPNTLNLTMWSIMTQNHPFPKFTTNF